MACNEAMRIVVSEYKISLGRRAMDFELVSREKCVKCSRLLFVF